jgi:valyl-tRNA synthetase
VKNSEKEGLNRFKKKKGLEICNRDSLKSLLRIRPYICEVILHKHRQRPTRELYVQQFPEIRQAGRLSGSHQPEGMFL